MTDYSIRPGCNFVNQHPSDKGAAKPAIATGALQRHIYGVLDVGRRTQAIAKARALRLL